MIFPGYDPKFLPDGAKLSMNIVWFTEVKLRLLYCRAPPFSPAEFAVKKEFYISVLHWKDWQL